MTTTLKIPEIRAALDPDNTGVTLDERFADLPRSVQEQMHAAANNSTVSIPVALLPEQYRGQVRRLAYNMALEFALYGYHLRSGV